MCQWCVGKGLVGVQLFFMCLGEGVGGEFCMIFLFQVEVVEVMIEMFGFVVWCDYVEVCVQLVQQDMLGVGMMVVVVVFMYVDGEVCQGF